MRFLSLIAAGVAAAALAAPAVATAAPLRTLSFDRLSRLDRATRLGPASPATPMRIGVALRRPDAAAEDAFVRALYDPASPSFHRFLTSARFTARFGVSAGGRAATARWLRAGGLRLDYGSPDYLLATGSVAHIQRLFGVRMA